MSYTHGQTLPMRSWEAALSSRSVNKCRMTADARPIIPLVKGGAVIGTPPKPRKRKAKDVSAPAEARDLAALLTDGDARKKAAALAKMRARRASLAA